VNDSRATTWPRHGAEARRPAVPVCCEECGTTHQRRLCPECGNPPDGVVVGVLRTEVVTGAGDRWLVTAERDRDSGGWVAVDYDTVDTDAGPESGTVWGPRP
jgi:hypothetical protein